MHEYTDLCSVHSNDKFSCFGTDQHAAISNTGFLFSFFLLSYLPLPPYPTYSCSSSPHYPPAFPASSHLPFFLLLLPFSPSSLLLLRQVRAREPRRRPLGHTAKAAVRATPRAASVRRERGRARQLRPARAFRCCVGVTGVTGRRRDFQGRFTGMQWAAAECQCRPWCVGRRWVGGRTCLKVGKGGGGGHVARKE